MSYDVGFDENGDGEDEELRQALDLHSMISMKGNGHYPEGIERPLVTAEQVIEEIDEILTMGHV
jgi:hypothetical protein